MLASQEADQDLPADADEVGPPACPTPRAGIEPATRALGERCSIQLSYRGLTEQPIPVRRAGSLARLARRRGTSGFLNRVRKFALTQEEGPQQGAGLLCISMSAGRLFQSVH